MGVPALFRWLQTKYPKVIEHVIDSQDKNADLLSSNPNGIEFDNLYLDINGIIHPCCHPEDRPPPKNEEEMLLAIYSYIDHIFSLIRPRKLLFLAADGVAPRAKMNQQRSRRFRAAKERELKKLTDEQEQRERGGELKRKGEEDDSSSPASSFDSNCITPGTPFMDLIMKGLKYYISDRVSKIPAWQNIRIVFSDSSVPGEGEHKIMEYIRRQRLDPQYDPNTNHVIYGLDADLIMLSLMTHEPHFKVLREDLFYEEKARKKRGRKEEEKPAGANDCEDSSSPPLKPFIFLDILTLRDYLSSELKLNNSDQIKYNLERLIDDWIFLCFFVGNDFLPHIPCLELREGAIDILIDIYKSNLDRLGGYICKNGMVNLERAQIILDELGKIENIIFRKRREKEEKFQRLSPSFSSTTNTNTDTSTSYHDSSIMTNDKKEKQSSSPLPFGKKQSFKTKSSSGNPLATMNNEESEREKKDDEDKVRLWEEGSKSRYYHLKFNVSQDDENAMSEIIKSYLEGLSWVMLYYFQGCPSWNWFYPYHYAPMASDFYLHFQPNNGNGSSNGNNNNPDSININDENDRLTTFEIGEPFLPFEQLMSVFPSASKDHIPLPFHHLMTDPDSELLDFYPESFEIDLNGKRHAWQGVVILPFIDEVRLLNAVRRIYPKLSKEEMRLNQFSDTLIYLHSSLINSNWIEQLKENTIIPMGNLNGFTGSISLINNQRKKKKNQSMINSNNTNVTSIAFPLPFESWDKLPEDIDKTVYSFVYYMPFYERVGLQHDSNLLPGVKLPPSKLTNEDRFFVESGQASKSFHSRLDIYPNNSRHQNHQNYQSQNYHQNQNRYQYQDHNYHHHQNYNYNYHGFNQNYNYRNESNMIDPASKYPPPINTNDTNMAANMNMNGNYHSNHHHHHNNNPYHNQESFHSLDHLEKKYKYPSFSRHGKSNGNNI